MGFSGLCNCIVPARWYTKGRNHAIDSVAIHTMAGNCSAYSCGVWFQTEKVQSADGTWRNLSASSNYGIGTDGSIGGYVDESDRSWCTSNGGVDNRAITIEVASMDQSRWEEQYQPSQEAYNSLINLLTDICTRYNFHLSWMNDKTYALAASQGGPVTRQNMFVHRWFDNKSCPGEWLFNRQGQIADAVNARLVSGGLHIPTLSYSQYDEIVTSTGKSTVVFIGDSRTVGMQYDVGDNTDIWSDQSSMGLDWMKEVGVPNVENKIDNTTAVAIMMGINDFQYQGARKYYEYINECANRWVGRGATVYFVSVNPVGTKASPGKYKHITNDEIQQFNQEVRSGLNTNCGYIDTYSAIVHNFNAPDGLHYDKETNILIYRTIKNSTSSGSTGGSSLYGSSAVIGGSPIQIDYQNLNPYVVTLSSSTPTKFAYDQLPENHVVGAIVEAGYLYSEAAHLKLSTFKQRQFDKQIQELEKNNIPYGYYFRARARNLREASSEMEELTFIIRHYPLKLGIWVYFELNNLKSDNNLILKHYEKCLTRLGFAGKIGIHITREELGKKITWKDFQDRWLLWLDEPVEDESELQQMLTPEFFDIEDTGADSDDTKSVNS